MFDNAKTSSIKNWLGSGSINLFGKPFSGKDTQARLLAEALGGNVVGGGEILRSSVLPERAQHCLDVGELIPSEDYVDIVLPFLSQPRLAGAPLILSAVGRWHGEEQGVIMALEKSSHPLKIVIHLDIDDIIAVERYKASKTLDDRQGRVDDDLEILKVRLNEFQTKTMPVIEYYRRSNILIEVNGIGSREEIANNIIDQLYGIATA